ncbi:hypothetical protein C2I27_04355 [Priestia megaterium]|uniref:hypothetical protein n=1 Tax=Priestia megaterium TaxID=1404 RepID=UPI000D507FEA|nr:hypothetical protein [Priestia megaterium]PVC63344.1 hypothetical protein C2I27_22805 [Priestia megaterium]PVC75124.1 hypothetical protein C2I27_04355 [Priestia megaterium]
MELVQEYVDQYEARQPRTVKVMGVGSTSTLYGGFEDDVRVYIGDQEIGRMQSISVSREEEPRDLGIITQYEGAFAIRNSVEGRRLYQDLIEQQMRDMSLSFGFSHPNRSERRKKASARKDEEEQDPYRKGLRTMLGGRGRWN